MRTLALLAALIAATALPALAQQTEPPDGTRITSAQVSGLDLAKLSAGLQEDIGKLSGTPLDRQQLKDLAARIETEQPRFVAALRITSDPDGSARVVFVVARADHQANVNAKYVVEDVRIKGASDSALDPALRADLQALTGKPLDADEAERLEKRLETAFPEYDVSHRTERGSQQGRVTLIFELTKSEWARWLRWEPVRGNGLYHSDQGWGAYLDLPISGRNIRVTPIFALDTADDLVEEYSGLGVRFEARGLGTERLGVSMEWSWFEQSWRNQTLTALALNPAIPGLYEERTTFTPLMTFAATRHLWISGGVSIVELEPLDSPFGLLQSRMANAAVGSIGYTLQHKETSAPRHDFDAVFTVKSGMDGLGSDFRYTRSLGQAEYWYRSAKEKQQVLISGMGGVINGDAPLFERFTLGDSRTLRGWNKYDIAPAGADRMVYASVEYRFHFLALFLDSGSVWNKDGERKFRVSTGFGFTAGPAFMTIGFPVNTGDLRAVFMIGFRPSGIGIRKY